MPGTLRKDDLNQFNQGAMDSMDFESGNFGTIKYTDGTEGEYLNFMGQGIMTKNGLEIKHLAILGSSMDDEQPEEDDSPEESKSVMKKIMKGDD